jgi:hypothetical protein
MAQAAMIGVPYITAWASVISAAQIQPGEIILIVGAAGAVGRAATQIANWRQARVIGADTSSDPIPGTEAVVNTKSEDLRERVLELTAGRGVDAVFDTVGGPMFEPALQPLRVGARHVVISGKGDPHVTFNLVDFYHNSSRLLGVDSYGLTSRQIAEIENELQPGFESRVLKPPPIEVLPFEKAVDACSRVAGGLAKANQALGTFNPLFPRGACFTPKMVPTLGPQNLIELHPMVQFQLRINITGSLAWDWYWRKSTHDGIYACGSGVLIDPASASHARYLGNQGDLEIRWAPIAQVILAFNLAGFEPGAFFHTLTYNAAPFEGNAGFTYRF